MAKKKNTEGKPQLEDSIAAIFKTPGGLSYASYNTILHTLTPADKNLITVYMRWANSVKFRKSSLKDYEEMTTKLDEGSLAALDEYAWRCRYTGDKKLSACTDWKFSGIHEAGKLGRCAACNRGTAIEYLAYSKDANVTIPLGPTCAVRFFGGSVEIMNRLNKGVGITRRDLGNAFRYGRYSKRLMRSRSRYRLLLLMRSSKLCSICAGETDAGQIFPVVDLEMWTSFISRGFMLPSELRIELKLDYMRALRVLFSSTDWAEEYKDMEVSGIPEFDVSRFAEAVLNNDFSSFNLPDLMGAELSARDFMAVLPAFDAWKISILSEILDPTGYSVTYNPFDLLYHVCKLEYLTNHMTDDLKSLITQVKVSDLILNAKQIENTDPVKDINTGYCSLFPESNALLWSALKNSAVLFSTMFALGDKSSWRNAERWQYERTGTLETDTNPLYAVMNYNHASDAILATNREKTKVDSDGEYSDAVSDAIKIGSSTFAVWVLQSHIASCIASLPSITADYLNNTIKCMSDTRQKVMTDLDSATTTYTGKATSTELKGAENSNLWNYFDASLSDTPKPFKYGFECNAVVNDYFKKVRKPYHVEYLNDIDDYIDISDLTGMSKTERFAYNEKYIRPSDVDSEFEIIADDSLVDTEASALMTPVLRMTEENLKKTKATTARKPRRSRKVEIEDDYEEEVFEEYAEPDVVEDFEEEFDTDEAANNINAGAGVPNSNQTSAPVSQAQTEYTEIEDDGNFDEEEEFFEEEEFAVENELPEMPAPEASVTGTVPDAAPPVAEEPYFEVEDEDEEEYYADDEGNFGGDAPSILDMLMGNGEGGNEE